MTHHKYVCTCLYVHVHMCVREREERRGGEERGYTCVSWCVCLCIPNNAPLPAMRGHGEIFSVKDLRNLYSSLVQPSMGMAIKAMIARYSCMSSSLCHWIWLVSIGGGSILKVRGPR